MGGRSILLDLSTAYKNFGPEEIRNILSHWYPDGERPNSQHKLSHRAEEELLIKKHNGDRGNYHIGENTVSKIWQRFEGELSS